MKLIKILGGITVASCVSLIILGIISNNRIDFSELVYEWDDVEDMDF